MLNSLPIFEFRVSSICFSSMPIKLTRDDILLSKGVVFMSKSFEEIG